MPGHLMAFSLSVSTRATDVTPGYNTQRIASTPRLDGSRSLLGIHTRMNGKLGAQKGNQHALSDSIQECYLKKLPAMHARLNSKLVAQKRKQPVE
ncbi:hypothetical protein PoB_002760200 [Plakobranchus ocellatus]|uniref:Uncharacterized protein n=1 Tax=Plakobranchus ocellatus TaxID=259542 RepID=A0AAV4A2I1_9GAST|nr:hypothetical protein PoB_002760200 [Plakobranchus ocellatus]